MTTIATDGKTMAGDGLSVLNGTIVSDQSVKVRRLESGAVMGFCGDSGDDAVFAEWLENGGKKPKLGTGFSAIVINPDAPVRVYFHDCTHDDHSHSYAIGSGADFAFAAMDSGKSPAEAVEIASRRCINTGGTITELSL